jgi:hypothetical protein
MATVHYNVLYLHLLSDATLGTFVELQVADYADQPQVQGEVRVYAGGRRKATRTPGADEQLSVTCWPVERVDSDQVRRWAGQPVLARFPEGHMVEGRYYAPTIAPNPSHPHLSTVALTVVAAGDGTL